MATDMPDTSPMPPDAGARLAALLDAVQAIADATGGPSTPIDAGATARLAVLLDAVHDALVVEDAPGVGELLRNWQSALQDLIRRGTSPVRDDLLAMHEWCVRLQQHLAGTLDHAGRRALVTLPTAIRWLPRLSPSFAHVILRRLDAASGRAPVGVRAPEAAPLWIGPEELDLARGAVIEQVLPLALPWADARSGQPGQPGDPGAARALAHELAYQCRLLGNAMELLGTRAIARGLGALAECLERDDAAVDPERIAQWAASLLDVFAQPCDASASALASSLDGLAGLGGTWPTELREEVARIVIGQDPAAAAARTRVARAEDLALAPASDVLPTVLDGMLRELPGNAERFGRAVRALLETRAPEAIDEARRVAHTLKGDANTVGVRGLANLTHPLEDILVTLARSPDRLDASCADALRIASDSVEEIADHLLGRAPAPSMDALCDAYQRALDAANALAGEALPTGEATPDVPAQGPGDTVAAPAAAAPDTTRTLTVASTLLDELQRLAGETLVAAHQADQQVARLGALHREQRQGARSTHDLLGRLDDLVALRGAALQSAQAAQADLDPLEIDQYTELHVVTRQLVEAHADGAESMRRIDVVMGALAELRSVQEQLSADLQRVTLRTRTVPFAQVAPRLQRIVRQTARQLGREATLEVVGGDVPIDAETLERVVEPIAHLLRNALDHGIEEPSVRAAAGKPEAGRIIVRVGLQGDTAVIDVEDDGRGLDHAAIRRRAVEAGLLGPDDTVDARQLERLVMVPGFSTRASATEVSGRGIGMDVAAQRVAALRGTLQLASVAGRGMRVHLRLPVTQTLANVLVTRGQSQASAVVASSVERVLGFAGGECRQLDGRLVVCVDGVDLPAWPMEAFHGERADPTVWFRGGGVGLLVRDALAEAHVILVRSIDDVRTVVVKPLGAHIPPIPAVRGITQLGDGLLAPVVDLDVLLQHALEVRIDAGALVAPAAAQARIVVADDSLSVRRALEQLMQDAGFEVATARDGVEALAEVNARATSVLLVDLEMPRMNGLELTRHLRTREGTRDLPVVMITSRATPRHAAMAQQAGVTRLLAKPVAEDALVQLVRGLVDAQRRGPAAGAQ